MNNKPVLSIALGMLMGISVIGVLLAMLNGDAFASDVRLQANGDIVVQLNRMLVREGVAAGTTPSAIDAPPTRIAPNDFNNPDLLLRNRIDHFQSRLGDALDSTRGTPIALATVEPANTPQPTANNRRDVTATAPIVARQEQPRQEVTATSAPTATPVPSIAPIPTVAPQPQPAPATPEPPRPTPPTIVAILAPTATFIPPATREFATPTAELPRPRPTRIPDVLSTREARPTLPPRATLPPPVVPTAVAQPTLAVRDWLATRIAETVRTPAPTPIRPAPLPPQPPLRPTRRPA